ncbi:hypothetical protein [uncultured Methanomethylovorans sp.]|jgi:hypothetical protein|nr:hypothetical protein [uncultured Methanomethylovorans sp.]
MKVFCSAARLRACDKKCVAEFEGTDVPDTCLFYNAFPVAWEEVKE